MKAKVSSSSAKGKGRTLSIYTTGDDDPLYEMMTYVQDRLQLRSRSDVVKAAIERLYADVKQTVEKKDKPMPSVRARRRRRHG